MFVLISTVEREICPPEFFWTKEKAQKAMKEQLADTLHIEVENLDEILVSDDEEYDGADAALNEDNAYCTNLNHDNVDWHIFEINFANIITVAQVNKAREILEDNGIDKDETDTVIQAIGYALLDNELFPDDENDDEDEDD